MDNNQKINCTVSSCKYNDKERQDCKLKQIIIEPIEECDTCEPDESMCGSYEYGENNSQ